MTFKHEKLREKNDVLIIAKQDGGVVEIDDIRPEYGELRSESEDVSVAGMKKIPVYRPTVSGRPPLLHRTVYYLDSEPADPGFDATFNHGTLRAAYRQSVAEQISEGEKQRRHAQMIDRITLAVGAGVLIFALVDRALNRLPDRPAHSGR